MKQALSDNIKHHNNNSNSTGTDLRLMGKWFKWVEKAIDCKGMLPL